MDRRKAIGLVGATVVAPAGFPKLASAQTNTEPLPLPPRLTTEELANRVKADGFHPKSLYAHEVEFRGVVKIKRDVPLLQIAGMVGPFSQVHLFGSGGNVDVGKEMIVVGLIVDHGYGALMIWKRDWKYADAEQGAAPDGKGR